VLEGAKGRTIIVLPLEVAVATPTREIVDKADRDNDSRAFVFSDIRGVLDDAVGMIIIDPLPDSCISFGVGPIGADTVRDEKKMLRA
jgi:hypothetical protein